MSKLSFVKEVQLRYYEGLFRFKLHSRDTFKWAKMDGFTVSESDAGNDMTQLMVVGVQVWKEDTEVWAPSHLDLGDVILDFSVPEIGYVNISKMAVYLERIPYRQWNRLLKADLFSKEVFSGIKEYHGDMPYSLHGSMQSHLVKSIENDYPSFTEAVESIVKGDNIAMAFAKDYAVSVASNKMKKLWVLLKNGPVGVVDKVDDEYVIAVPKSMEFLIEDLEQYHTTICYE